jgi:hypothetical protein
MSRGFLGLVTLSLLLVGCVGPRRAVPGTSGSFTPEPYVRIASSDSNHVALQIAAREFVPARRGEPVVWLAGVSHIGESNYYAALQAQLDVQTLVLFDGVGAADAASATNNVDQPEPAHKSADADSNDGNRASLQSAMAAALGLVFQLDAIDYRRPNFRNSDLTIMQLRELMAQQEAGSPKPGASQSFEDLLGLMEGNSWFDWLIQAALRFLGSSPKFQALGRLALIDLLGQLQGDPSRLEGLPPDMKQLLEVLLQRRNEKVIGDLQAELPQIDRHGSIAVFFGTGHMPDLEKRLRGQLKYSPKRDLWFTAFDVDLGKSKVSPSERAFIDDFVKWQLAEASRKAAK